MRNGIKDKIKPGFTYKQVCYDGTMVAIKIAPDSTLPDQLQAFAQFLRGCGYHFDGELEIVDDSANDNAYKDEEPEYTVRSVYANGEEVKP